MQRRSFVLVGLLVWSASLYGTSWDSIGHKWGSFGKGIVSGVKQVGSALGQMVGYISPDYVYSLQVYNGLQSNVSVQTKHYSKVMGGRFSGKITHQQTLGPGQVTGSEFDGVHLYFSLEIPDCNYSEPHFTLGEKNDKTVYVYHTFNDPYSLKPSAERLGVISATSKEFSGLIYNGSGKTGTIGFLWNGKTVIVPVEEDTFSTLASDQNNSLRPSVLLLNGQKVVLSAVGMGSSSSSGSGSKTVKTTNPSRYNYQLTPNGGVETGLFPGNYRQPGVEVQSGQAVKVPAKLRDITPMNIQIWNQFAQGEQGVFWNLKPISMPNEPLWFMYTGQGITNEGKIVNTPVGHIPEGKCVSLTLLRPPVSQGLAKLYMVRINTTDQDAAEQFLNQLAHTKLPQYNIPAPTKQMIADSEKTLLTEKLPDTVGYVNNDAGLRGVIVGTDIFASYGAATIGPFFYTATAPQFALSAVQASCTQAINNITPAAKKELNEYIQQWVESYPTNPDGVRRAVEIFLIKNGSGPLVSKNGNEASLTKAGYAVLSTLLYGPTSVSRLPKWYPSLQKTTITAPDVWASSKDIIIV